MNKIALCVGVLLAGGLASCSSEGDIDRGSGEGNGNGYVEVSLKSDPLAVEVSGSKAEVDPTYRVDFVDQNGNIAKSIADHKQITEPIALRAGSYTVKAYGENESTDAGFETPYYAGEATATVKSGASTVVEIVCNLANVKVSVSYAANIKDNFTEYAVTVTNEDKGSLIFEENENRAGYLKCTGTLVWKLNLRNKNGTSYELTQKIPNVKPRQHYNLAFSINESADPNEGGVTTTITVDKTTNDHNHSMDVVLNPKNKPQVVGTGFDIDQTFAVTQGTATTCEMSLLAEAKVSDIQLSHSSAYLSSLGIPTEVSLVSVDATTEATIRAKGITWTTPVSDAMLVKLNFGTLLSALPLGDYAFNLLIVDTQNQRVNKTLNVTVAPDVDVTTLDATDIWAKFATVNAKWNSVSQPEGVTFAYKKTSDAQWTTLATSAVTVSAANATFSATLTGLEPATAYQVKAVTSTQDNATAKSFTTQSASQLENMNLESWTSKYVPAGPWCSGNNSFVKMTSKETTTVATTGGVSAKLQAKAAVGMFAAGNLFTGGNFAIVGTSGGEMDFGVAYTDRPTSLSGYYNYTPGSVDYAADAYSSMKGQSDICQIYVLLADWDQPFHINTTTSTLIDVNDTHIIAYGQLSNNQSTNGWSTFNIPLEYRSSRTPKYALIVATTSKYGDYFTGSTGSVLYVDELSFGFEAPVTWKQ
ncbi:MAG: DUF4493 domain-containing protein [Alistipes sp.]|nr:DUF4493 domain-containing protein [Alistipes sp.]